MGGIFNRTEKEVNLATDRIKFLDGWCAGQYDEICLRDFPAHSSRRGETLMGTEERRMRVKGVSLLLLGDKSWKREAMRVY